MNVIKSSKTELNEIVKANNLKAAIAAAQGRTIMGEVVTSAQNKYAAISNVKLLNGFGTDMITLKKYDYLNYKMDKYQSYNNISSLIGLNYEIKFDGVELDTFCDDHLDQIDFKHIDYVVLTIYPQNTINLSDVKQSVENLRNRYSGFIFINFYVKNPHQFKQDVIANLDWIKDVADMVSMPIPGTVYGITTDDAIEVVKAAHENGVLVAGTICTSQEGADSNVLTNLGTTAKMCGFDVHMFGDAAACDMPEEENIFEYSKIIRGKRHTYFRMNA